MTVYVDEAAYKYGRMIMCHMLADTPAELLGMARRIDIRGNWFQYKASAPHFDICKSKREQAIRWGAVPVDRKTLVEVMRRVKQSWPRDERGWMHPGDCEWQHLRSALNRQEKP